jgi:hypothetical protein
MPLAHVPKDKNGFAFHVRNRRYQSLILEIYKLPLKQRLELPLQRQADPFRLWRISLCFAISSLFWTVSPCERNPSTDPKVT